MFHDMDMTEAKRLRYIEKHKFRAIQATNYPGRGRRTAMERWSAFHNSVVIPIRAALGDAPVD